MAVNTYVCKQDLVSLSISSIKKLPRVNVVFNSFQDQLELSIREKSGLHETERQLLLKIKTLQNCLKTEKDEVEISSLSINIYKLIHNATR